MSEPDGSATQRYRYAGVPLLPSHIEELTIELFAGQIPKRIEIANAVVAEHERRGGLPSPADPMHQTKKALRRLKEDGKAIPHGFGRYRIVGPSSDDASHATEGPPAPEPRAAADPEPSRELGTGAESVYVWYSPRDQQIARLAGSLRWNCKVGRTAGPVEGRVGGQGGTALSERPRIDLVIHTPNSRVLEAALHAVLKLKGRHAADAPGKEWFRTSPDEVAAIYETLTNSWN